MARPRRVAFVMILLERIWQEDKEWHGMSVIMRLMR
jgi:hypothetical protein